LGLINLVMIPIDPFIATTYSEIAFTIARRQWVETKRVLKRVSVIAGGWTLAAGGGLALTGYWLIPLMYGAEYGPAYPAVLLLLVGYGFANILYWNRPLLLAFGMPAFPLKISTLAGAAKTALTFGLVPVYGYLIEAAILSSYFVVSITIIAWRGLGELKQRLAVGSQLSPVSDPQPPSG
jgi:O-antigen/teichoic acid export membrane protein